MNNKLKIFVPGLIIGAMLLALVVGQSVLKAQNGSDSVVVNNYAEGGIILGGSGSGDLLGATGTRFPNGVAVGSGASVDTTGAFSVGNDGSQLQELITGTCNITTSVVGSHAATTTAQYFCAVTGAESGDKVFASLPSTAFDVTTYGGFAINAAYATSSDFIGLDLVNLTGSATSSFSGVTTSVQYWISR